jgi:predicted XRE-type DNA-binding protein
MLPMFSDSPLVTRVKRSVRSAILNRLEADGIRRGRQQRLSERLGLHQPDVSRLLAGKLDHLSVDVLLRTAEKLGAEFTYDPKADAESVLEYTKLLALRRDAKSDATRETVNVVVKALKTHGVAHHRSPQAQAGTGLPPRPRSRAAHASAGLGLDYEATGVLDCGDAVGTRRMGRKHAGAVPSKVGLVRSPGGANPRTVALNFRITKYACSMGIPYVRTFVSLPRNAEVFPG